MTAFQRCSECSTPHDSRRAIQQPSKTWIPFPSACRFSQESDLLLAASWDKVLILSMPAWGLLHAPRLMPLCCMHTRNARMQTVRVYDAAQKVAKGSILHRAPVLDVCMQDDQIAYAAGLDGHVTRIALPQLTVTSSLGTHNSAVRCISFLASRGAPCCVHACTRVPSDVRGLDPAQTSSSTLTAAGLVLTGSWDQTVRAWDPRSPPGQCCVQTIPVPGKVSRRGAPGNSYQGEDPGHESWNGEGGANHPRSTLPRIIAFCFARLSGLRDVMFPGYHGGGHLREARAHL
jgi:hypothetical protein